MLTIFTVPKKFQGHFAVIQENAILSWKKLHPDIEIILCGNDSGVGHFAKANKLIHIPNIKRNKFNTPLLDDIFSQAINKAKKKIATFINADIILLDDFLSTISKVRFSNFLLSGRHYDLKLNQKVKFSSNWQKQLKDKLKGKKQDRLDAMDYFVFPKHLNLNPPPFAIGRTAWDNWLVYRARSLKLPVIDASKEITAIHQEHDYSHAGGYRQVWFGPERFKNWQLAGNMRRFFNLHDATWEFKDKKLVKIPLSKSRLIRAIEKFPVLYPRVGIIAEPLIFIFRLVKFVKDKLKAR